MRRKLIFFGPLAILGLLVFLTLGGFIVQWLWNWLLPTLFGWPAVTFWQALALLALCRILFGGLGRHGMRHGRWRDRDGARSWFADRMVDRMGERWDRMSPEERERIRQRIRERFGFGTTSGGSGTSGGGYSGGPFGTM